MTKITYLLGDATYPMGNGKKTIVHICNDKNGWGGKNSFVNSLSARWKEPQEAFHKLSGILILGNVQFVQVTRDIIVCNMIAQHGIGPDDQGNPPIRYDALRKTLKAANTQAFATGSDIHGPKFGTGLSGGDWKEIVRIINEVITVPVYVYDLKPVNGYNYVSIGDIETTDPMSKL